MTKHAEKHEAIAKGPITAAAIEGAKRDTDPGAPLVPVEGLKGPEQKPSMGRIVIFSHPGGPHALDQPAECPAIVTKVEANGLLTLFVMAPDGSTGFHPHVDYGKDFGTWHWPPRV